MHSVLREDCVPSSNASFEELLPSQYLKVTSGTEGRLKFITGSCSIHVSITMSTAATETCVMIPFRWQGKLLVVET